MKRFIVMLALTVAIAGVLTYAMPKSFEDYLEDISSDATVSIYCRETGLNCINMGSGKIVQCSVAELNSALAHCKDIDGLSVSFYGSEQDVDRIVSLFNLDVKSSLNIDGLRVICGNSARLTGGVMLDGEKVNLQIAYKDKTVTVGSPLILGDY